MELKKNGCFSQISLGVFIINIIKGHSSSSENKKETLSITITYTIYNDFTIYSFDA